ncbi:MAG: hypothetical protein V1797_00455 [Pseudomonadota bacterium]
MPNTQHLISIATEKHWGEWLISGVAALGTAGGLIYALYRDSIVHYLRRPKFLWSIGTEKPYLTEQYLGQEIIYGSHPVKGCAFHASVKNTGKSRATNCTVELTEIWTEHHQAPNKYRKRNNYLPAPLKWSNEEKDANINRGQTKFVDIGYLVLPLLLFPVNDNPFSLNDPCSLQISFAISISDGIVKELECGQKHRINITVYGDNFNPATDNWFEIFIPEEWNLLHPNFDEIIQHAYISYSNKPKKGEIYFE